MSSELVWCVYSHPGTGKYFAIASHATGLVMQVDGDVIEAGSKVVMADRAMMKVKGGTSESGSVILRQQFCVDEMTGTIRSAFRYYCLHVDDSMSRASVIYQPTSCCVSACKTI